jgi:hypothetical protein
MFWLRNLQEETAIAQKRIIKNCGTRLSKPDKEILPFLDKALRNCPWTLSN